MIRLEKLADGTLLVTDEHGQVRFWPVDELPQEIATQFALLNAADMGSEIEWVGRRLSATVFWLYKSPADVKML